MMIRNQTLCRAEVNGMTTGIFCRVGVITTVNNLASHFDAKKPVGFRAVIRVAEAGKLAMSPCSRSLTLNYALKLSALTLQLSKSTHYSPLSPLGLLAFFSPTTFCHAQSFEIGQTAA
jgi:hypothetical protein